MIKQYSFVLSTLPLCLAFNGKMCGATCTKATNRGIKINPCDIVLNQGVKCTTNVLRMDDLTIAQCAK